MAKWGIYRLLKHVGVLLQVAVGVLERVARVPHLGRAGQVLLLAGEDVGDKKVHRGLVVRVDAGLAEQLLEPRRHASGGEE